MFYWVVKTSLICNFVLPRCRMNLLDTTIEYEQAVENTREKGSKEHLHPKSFNKTVLSWLCITLLSEEYVKSKQ